MMSENGQTSGSGWTSPRSAGSAPTLPIRRASQFTKRRARNKRAFTLIETALAIVIVGTGVLAIMTAQAAFHQQNDWSTHTSTATFLANEIREMTDRLPLYDPVTGNANWGPESNELTLADFDDLDDFDGDFGAGVAFSNADGSGPVNAMRQVIPGMTGWTQIIKVFNVDPTDISAAGDPNMDGTTDMMRIEVTVTYQGANDPTPVDITTVSWVTGN